MSCLRGEWATSFEYRLVSSPDEEALEDDFVSLSMRNVEKELPVLAGAGAVRAVVNVAVRTAIGSRCA